MRLRTLQVIFAATLLQTTLFLLVRMIYQLTMPIPAFSLFEACDDQLCWHNIQPGATSMVEAENLLATAGFTEIQPFEGEYVYAGLAVDAVDTDEAYPDNDSYITSDVERIVANITLARQLCSHVVLAAWGKPDTILRFRYRNHQLIYLYNIGANNTVAFRSDSNSSLFSAVILMAPEGFARFEGMSLYNYDEVTWQDAVNVLKRDCTPPTPES